MIANQPTQVKHIRTTATEESYLNPVATAVEADHLFKELSDLVNEKFSLWYYKRFMSLNRERILQLASIARADGNDPKRYFSFLLKKERI